MPGESPGEVSGELGPEDDVRPRGGGDGGHNRGLMDRDAQGQADRDRGPEEEDTEV